MQVKESERYRVTEQILKKYRDIKWEIEVCEMQAEKKNINTDTTTENLRIREYEKKKNLVQCIDSAAELLRKKQPFGELYYWSLYYTYFSTKACSGIDEIVGKVTEKTHLVSYKTYTRRRKEAVGFLSDMLFGYTHELHIPGFNEHEKNTEKQEVN